MDCDSKNDGQPAKGSKIRVISKAAIRYEGYLESADFDKFTLSNVCSFGTEERISYNPVKSYQFYDYVSFRAEYIDSITIIQSFQPPQSIAQNRHSHLPSIINPVTQINSSRISPCQNFTSSNSINLNNQYHDDLNNQLLNEVQSRYQNNSSYSNNTLNRSFNYHNHNSFNRYGYLNYYNHNTYRYRNASYLDNGWRQTAPIRRIPVPYTNYSEEFDFEESNRKFEKLRGSENTHFDYDNFNDEKFENDNNSLDKVDTVQDATTTVEKTLSCYDKKKSFFDNVSNKDSLSNCTNKPLQRAQNTETFGYEFVQNSFWTRNYKPRSYYNPRN